MTENINWYPGHMKKTREMIAENLKMVGAVLELLDARIPVSSRNPIIGELVGQKPRIVILNKSDLADKDACLAWAEYLRGQGQRAVIMDAMNGKGTQNLMKELEKVASARAGNSNLPSQNGGPHRNEPAEGRHGSAGRNTGNHNAQMRMKNPRMRKPLRLMIVGVPNVGKSSLINRLTGRRSARVGDKPGVTRGKQWLTLKNGMQLLDTPGILWPKFEDQRVGLNLAFCGSIKDEILNREELAIELLKTLSARYPDLLMERYKLDSVSEDAFATLHAIAEKRGFIMGGGRMDYERCARTVLDEFRDGKIGRITLEFPER